MNLTIDPGSRYGVVDVPCSKSDAQRLLICAALSGKSCSVVCHEVSDDVMAMCDCLRALCADISLQDDRFIVIPRKADAASPITLPCGESGAVLRFLLPVAGALGVSACFRTAGRLSDRPLGPLISALSANGLSVSRIGTDLYCSGRLTPGRYQIPGNISSQFVSGLLFALPLLEGESRIDVTGQLVSEGYIRMTEDALRLSGIPFTRESDCWYIPGDGSYLPPAVMYPEADWSGAAVFLSMGALSPRGVFVRGLNLSSLQPDREILDILQRFGAIVTISESGVGVRRGDLVACDIDVSGTPDLMPVICAVAAGARGVTRITGASHLRGKESDRLHTVAALLKTLDTDVTESQDGLLISGKRALCGGTVSSFDDHRIVMAATVAASLCREPVTVMNAECAAKSFHGFDHTLNTLEVVS